MFLLVQLPRSLHAAPNYKLHPTFTVETLDDENGDDGFFKNGCNGFKGWIYRTSAIGNLLDFMVGTVSFRKLKVYVNTTTMVDVNVDINVNVDMSVNMTDTTNMGDQTSMMGMQESVMVDASYTEVSTANAMVLKRDFYE